MQLTDIPSDLTQPSTPYARLDNLRMKPKPKSYRKEKTLTRSISFEEDVFNELERRRVELRMTRSEYIRAVLEDVLEILPHPELQLKVEGKRVLKVEESNQESEIAEAVRLVLSHLKKKEKHE
jgi:hypothetical protein